MSDVCHLQKKRNLHAIDKKKNNEDHLVIIIVIASPHEREIGDFDDSIVPHEAVASRQVSVDEVHLRQILHSTRYLK